MKHFFAGLCLLLGSCASLAADRWQFSDPIAVAATDAAAVFHHLDGAARKHIAVSGDLLAIAWEDNRNGSPQVYTAVKLRHQTAFSSARRASTGAEAYEPAIIALSSRRFVLGYEQDAAVYLRVLAGDSQGKALRLGLAASHISLAAWRDRVVAAWRERRAGRWSLRIAILRVDKNNRFHVERQRPVEVAELESPVLFPSVAINAAGLCVAWEDRRAGHTRLLSSYSADLGAGFTAPVSLNEFFSNRNQYDQGNGVARVSLASFGSDEILAAWMDKRRGGFGYGIFASLGSDAGKIFGPNEKVHGAEGDRQPHHNPATAGNPDGAFVVAWDDYRRGDSDIWLSAYNDDLEWSEDHAPAVASGSGEQSHPSVALDAQGNLHLLWIERENLDGPSRLWYSFGRLR